MSTSDIEQFWIGASADGRARYKDLKLIGAGAYSVVARATDQVTGERVAIKRIGEVFYDALEAKKVNAQGHKRRSAWHSAWSCVGRA